MREIGQDESEEVRYETLCSSMACVMCLDRLRIGIEAFASLFEHFSSS